MARRQASAVDGQRLTKQALRLVVAPHQAVVRAERAARSRELQGRVAGHLATAKQCCLKGALSLGPLSRPAEDRAERAQRSDRVRMLGAERPLPPEVRLARVPLGLP